MCELAPIVLSKGRFGNIELQTRHCGILAHAAICMTSSFATYGCLLDNQVSVRRPTLAQSRPGAYLYSWSQNPSEVSADHVLSGHLDLMHGAPTLEEVGTAGCRNEQCFGPLRVTALATGRNSSITLPIVL
jgi:hypothetical protein